MNLVAIVGRPNVGKSTLFNRIIRKKDAIVEDTPGVTRDRIYGVAEWNGINFMLVDTGGFVPSSEDQIEKAIREQAQIAIEEAQVVLFVCDGREGVTPFDYDIANILRTSNKPVVLVINKCDNPEYDLNAYDFARLGLGDPFPISAISGRSTGDFLDQIVSYISESEWEEKDDRLKIAIVGRPNVGKSSLTNALLGQNRSIVTNIPGTTRDAIDSVLKYYGQEILLIDTAGLRRRSSIKENIEFYSILRTSRAIERSDVSIVLLDATLGLEDQDKKIINQVDKSRKGIIIAVNKWDLVEKDSSTADKYTTAIKNLLQNYYYIPVVYISALTKQRIFKLIDFAIEIHKNRKNRITTAKLNKLILPELEKTPPPAIQGKDLRINYITQVKTEPPVFAFFCNYPQLIPESYKRFMEKILRKHFDYTGTPISFIFRRKNINWEEL